MDRRALRSWSLNTRRAYVVGWKDFTSWCLEHRCTGRPAAPSDVGRYLEHLVETEDKTMATARMPLTAITAAHRLGGPEDPTTRPLVQATMKRLAREYGKPRKQAKGLTSKALTEDTYTFMACTLGASIPGLSGTNTAPAVGERSWPSLELLRNTPEFSRKLPDSAGELDDSVSPPWRGPAVRLTRRPGQRGQHHAPTGIFLGRLDQEFSQRNIDVEISEFEVEGGPHVGGAYEARRRVVLASLLPQSLALGEGHVDPAVAAGNGAFDRDFSGHPPNIATTAPGGGSGHAGRVRDWRGIMAKELVHATSDGPASERRKKVELALVGVGNKSWNFGNTLW